MGGLSSLQKSEFLKLIFAIIFGSIIEISGTKWVEKKTIYFFYFWFKKAQFENSTTRIAILLI